MKKNNAVRTELERLFQKYKGIPHPEQVVNEARRHRSPLHHLFTWDDTKAAEQYRIWQARKVIMAHVVMIDAGGVKETRAFVSLSSDRMDGGYRAIGTVLNNKEMRQQLLADAIRDMRIFQQKYRMLNELVSVFDAMRKVRAGRARHGQVMLGRAK